LTGIKPRDGNLRSYQGQWRSSARRLATDSRANLRNLLRSRPRHISNSWLLRPLGVSRFAHAEACSDSRCAARFTRWSPMHRIYSKGSG